MPWMTFDVRSAWYSQCMVSGPHFILRYSMFTAYCIHSLLHSRRIMSTMCSGYCALCLQRIIFTMCCVYKAEYSQRILFTVCCFCNVLYSQQIMSIIWRVYKLQSIIFTTHLCLGHVVSAAYCIHDEVCYSHI
jgi:hypothetical protein